MKKQSKRLLVAIILCGVLLGGCTPLSTDSDDTGEKAEDVFVDNPAEDEAYFNIDVHECKGFIYTYLGIKGSVYSLRINLSSDWEMRAAENGQYDLCRGGQTVGKIQKGEASDVEKWKILSTETKTLSKIKVVKYLEKYGAGQSLKFRYRYCYSYIESGRKQLLTLTADYAELDEYLEQLLFSKAILLNIYTDPMYNELSDIKDEPLLILGNSFIGTSDIGDILNDIMESNGKQSYVTAVSRGYARVRTYTEDEYMMQRIRNGEWGAVFICGFYDDETECLGLLKEACDASGTVLVIFPAHNENVIVIEKNCDAYPSLPVLNWKGEIQALIDEGRSKWDFCINDQHYHSNSLAGYVGAMMIYRAIYGEMPTARLFSFDQSAYDKILGDYIERPYMEQMNPDNVIVVG